VLLNIPSLKGAVSFYVCQKKELIIMSRPKKPMTEKLLDNTYRKDRDSNFKIDKNKGSSKYEVIKEKLLEVEILIKETPVKGNEKLLIGYASLYQKFINILEAPSLESREPKNDTNILDQLIKKKKN
jgi:hypothetical protein